MPFWTSDLDGDTQVAVLSLRDDAVGQVGPNTIGRDPAATVFLDVAGVSRRTARESATRS